MFIMCCVTSMVRPDVWGLDNGSLCFRACSSALLGHPKGGSPGGIRVVTSYTSVVPRYAGSFGYDGAPRIDWGRPRVVTAPSVRLGAASRLAYSPTFGYHVGVHSKM